MEEDIIGCLQRFVHEVRTRADYYPGIDQDALELIEELLLYKSIRRVVSISRGVKFYQFLKARKSLYAELSSFLILAPHIARCKNCSTAAYHHSTTFPCDKPEFEPLVKD